MFYEEEEREADRIRFKYLLLRDRINRRIQQLASQQLASQQLASQQLASQQLASQQLASLQMQ
jgi:hypothetical protein